MHGGLRRECWDHWPSLSADLGIAVDIGDGSSALLFLPRSPASLLSLSLLKVLGIVTNSHREQLHTLLSSHREADGPCGHGSGTRGTQHREPGLFRGVIQLNKRDRRGARPRSRGPSLRPAWNPHPSVTQRKATKPQEHFLKDELGSDSHVGST